DLVIKSNDNALREIEEAHKLWEKSTLAELNKRYAAELKGRKLTEAMRREQVEDLADDIRILKSTLADQRARRSEVREEKNKLNLDSLAESRRMADLQAKLTRALADVDLLIVPRITLRNVARSGENLPNWYHKLDETQTNVLRDFLKQGKPILACFGP